MTAKLGASRHVLTTGDIIRTNNQTTNQNIIRPTTNQFNTPSKVRAMEKSAINTPVGKAVYTATKLEATGSYTPRAKLHQQVSTKRHPARPETPPAGAAEPQGVTHKPSTLSTAPHTPHPTSYTPSAATITTPPLVHRDGKKRYYCSLLRIS